MIQTEDIKEGAKFRTTNGNVWVIDEIEKDNLVRTHMQPGQKGNYRDALQTVVDFLNEEKAEKIN